MAFEKMLQKSVQLALVAMVSTPMGACAANGKVVKIKTFVRDRERQDPRSRAGAVWEQVADGSSLSSSSRPSCSHRLRLGSDSPPHTGL
jgi:hypothetical protein